MPYFFSMLFSVLLIDVPLQTVPGIEMSQLTPKNPGLHVQK